MPALSSNASIFRRGGFTYTGYISTPPLTVVLAGTVTAVPTYPALAIAYTLTSGSEANALPDLLVNFYSSGGAKKATLRIATGAANTSTSLKVNEFSAGVYNVQVGDTFRVIKVWNIFDRLVAASSTLNKDSRIAYTDQNANQNPVTNSGGANTGFSITRNFYGDTSYVIDPDSSGAMAHLWDYIDGSGTTNVANPSGVSFPVGFRWVKHTGTDSSNSKATIQYVPTWVHDKTTYPPLAVQLDSLSGNVESGWRCSFKLPVGSEGDITSLPDGSLIVYWEVSKYRSAENSYGSDVDDRSNVRFVGYLISDSIHVDPSSNEVTFEAVSPLEILSQTPSLPQLMVSATSPTKWSEVKSLSTKTMFNYLTYWHSTLQDAFDMVWNDGLDLSFDRIAVQGDSIADQLRDIANSLNLQVTCDRLGRILFTRDPAFLSSGERSGRTKTYDLTAADVMEIDITRNHRWAVKTVRGEGITSSNAPVFSNAPGNAPASLGTGSETFSKQIISSQSQLNERTGYQFAKLNSLLNGQIVPKGARVKLPDGYDWFEPAYREFITLTLASDLNTRGVGWDNTTKWTVESVDIAYDMELGSKEINVTIDHETSGVAGVTYIPPQEDDNGLPDEPPIDVTFPDTGVIPGTDVGVSPIPPPGSPTSPSTANMAAFADDNTISFTADFDTPEASGGPDWTTTPPLDLTGLSGWGGGDLISFEVDDYSPSYMGTGDEVNGVLLTDECVQRIEDIFGTPALGSANVFADASTAATLAMDRSTEGFGIVARWVAGDGVYALVTADGGATWTENLVTAFENTEAGGIAPGVFISPHAELAYISVWTATGDNTDAAASLYKSLDSGATWSHLTSPDIDSGVDVSSFIGVAFDNAPANRIFHRRKDADGLHLIRNSNGTETDITPEPDALYVPIGQRLHELAIPDDDEDTLAIIGVSGLGATAWSVVFLGTELARGVDGFGQPYIDVEAEVYPPFGGYGVFVATGGDDICCTLIGAEIIGGEQNLGGSGWALCGEELFTIDEVPPHTSGFITGANGLSIRELRVLSITPITYRITFAEDCADEGAVIYALLTANNALAETPTWSVVDSGDQTAFPYREIYSIGSGKYLVMGVDGSIGVASSTAINSRKGDIATTGQIVGTAGA